MNYLKKIQSVYALILAKTGFKKFMWAHATLFWILVFMMLTDTIQSIINSNFDLNLTLGITSGLLFIYFLFRWYQSVCEKKIVEDRFDVFFGGGLRKK